MSNKWNPVERFVDSKYLNASLSTTLLTEKHQKVLEEWIKEKKGFLIYLGVPGCGKTYTSISCARFLFNQLKKIDVYPSVFYYPIRDLYAELKNLYSNKQSDFSLKERLKTADFLALDDIGSSRLSDWEKEIILDVIDGRYSREKHTIITSNLRASDFKEYFDERTSSRLLDKNNFYIEDWENDYRRM